MMRETANWYQQPCAVCDKIICGWQVQHTGELFEASICLRDLFSGSLATRTVLTQAEVGQLRDFVFAKLSAVLQVTDTTVAFPFKRCADEAMEDLRREMRELAEDENVHAVYKCQLYEMVRIVCVATQKLVAKQEPEDAIQKGTYAAGWLAVRPDLDKGIMRRSDEAEWTKSYDLGGHRMKASWVAERYRHLQNGKIADMTIADLETAGIRLQEVLHSPELEAIQTKMTEEGFPLDEAMQLQKAVELTQQVISAPELGGKVKMKSWEDIEGLENGIDVPSFEIIASGSQQHYALEGTDENFAPLAQVGLMNKHSNVSTIAVIPNPLISKQRSSEEAASKNAKRARDRAKERAAEKEAALEQFREIGKDHSSAQMVGLIQAMDTQQSLQTPFKRKLNFISRVKNSFKKAKLAEPSKDSPVGEK